jgi:transposase InsO family protein
VTDSTSKLLGRREARHIHDSLISGRHFRAFAVLDQWSRESLAIEVDLSLTGDRVTRVLERLRTTRGLPLVIQADNGPELRGRTLDQWAYEHGVRLQFIEPGKLARTGGGTALGLSAALPDTAPRGLAGQS